MPLSTLLGNSGVNWSRILVYHTQSRDTTGMTFYLLCRGFENQGKPYYTSRKGDLDGREWWRFDEGKKVENWLSRAWIKSRSTSEDGPPDDGLVNHFALLIFSSRMRIALERAGVAGVQYLPIHILKSDGSEYEGFSIANILNFPWALDLEKSDFSVYPEEYSLPTKRGKISSLRKAVLRKSPLQGFDILRLKDFPEAVFVSQKFHDIYADNKFTGYSFSRVQTSES
jgi:hypothetical protein